MQEKMKKYKKYTVLVVIIALVLLSCFLFFQKKTDYQWVGTYRATTNTYPDSSRYITDSVMVEILEKNEEYQISVLGKKVTGSQNGAGSSIAQTYISCEENLEIIKGNAVSFQIDMFPDDEMRGLYYIELVKVSGDEMGFRHASSQEELKNAEYVILVRTEN